MSVWYAFLNALGIRMFEMDFMKNALLAVLLLGTLIGLLSTMIVTGKMSFFSDALGHSGFTGIAIGVLCGAVQPIYFAVGLSVLFALLFSFVRSRTSQSADTIIGVFSSTAVALGIFIVTLGGRSFTKFNRYLIGDILSVSPQEIGLLALVLLAVVLLITHAQTELSVACIGAIVAILTLIVLGLTSGKKSVIEIIKGVDYKTLLFFIGLFVSVAGLEKTGVLNMIANFITSVSEGNIAVIVIVILWISDTLDWTLSIGTDVGGSATPSGASANVVALSQCGKNGITIGWGRYCKYCVPATIIVMAVSTAYLFLRYL